MSTPQTRTRIIGLLLAAAALTAACGTADVQPEVPLGSAAPFPADTNTSSAPTTTTTTGAGSSAPAPEDAAAQAMAGLNQYIDVINLLYNSQSDPATALAAVATGIEITNATNDVKAARKSGTRFVRGAGLTNVQVGAVDSSAMSAVVQITACVGGAIPVGQTTAPDGSSQQGRFYMANTSWPDPAGWRVNDSDLRGEPCTA